VSGFDVDVVIPAHQAEGTVAAAVRSALGQTLKPIRVFVVADTCVDATARVAQEAGAEVILAKAGSPAAARNLGVREGRATFIAFLDADDRWHSTWLEAAARAHRLAPTSGVLYGDIEECLSTGAYLPRTERRMPAGRVRDALLLSSFITTSAVVVRREALIAVNGFDETLRQIEDLDLWLRLAEAHDFTPVPGRHVTYVRTPGSAMRDPAHLNRIRDQQLRVIEAALARGRPGKMLQRRALANVYFASAARHLAAGAARAALRDAADSFRRWPLDPALWATAALALQPERVRGTILTARRWWRQDSSRRIKPTGSPT
jgi:glycosyltransferase involved in cell wall biosynthesis